jgi:hypothetical protein
VAAVVLTAITVAGAGTTIAVVADGVHPNTPAPATTPPVAVATQPAIPTPSTLDPDDLAALQLLDRNIPTVGLPGVALTDSIEYLRDITGANIFVNWKALHAANVTESKNVTESVTNKKFSQVLNDILAQAGANLLYDVHGGVIVITTKDQLALAKTRPGPDLRDIRDSKDPRLSAADRPADLKLERPLPSVQLPNVSFSDSIEFLRDITAADIYVDWNAIQKVGVTKQTPVTFVAHNIRLWAVLDFLLIQAGDENLGYKIDHGLITISTINNLNGSVKSSVENPH